MRITTELFKIPYKNNFIVYSPLKRMAFLVNKATIDILSSSREISQPDDKTRKVIELFKKQGIVDDEPDKPPKSNKEFIPTKVTIFPTSDCNMRCVYCYGNGGENPKYLKWGYAKAAIDFIVKNALRKKVKSIDVGFHGGGEPLFAWDMFKKSVEYSKRIAKKNKLKCRVSTATNGVLNEEQIRYLANNNVSITLSIDGPKDIQNLQRPLVNNTGSFNILMNTIKRFNKLKISYAVRATISDKNVKRMTEMVGFFNKNCNVKKLHFEPLFVCGRCKTSEWESPNDNIFIKEFIKAEKRARKKGISLYFSGMRLDSITNTFCGAAGRNFCVTPEGYVTSCFEVSRIEDPRSNIFFYGRYDEEKKRFIFNKKKLDYLLSRRVDNMPFCSGCFAKWHCAGDCLVKVASNGDMYNPKGYSRCKMNREMVKEQIVDSLINKKSTEKLKMDAIPC